MLKPVETTQFLGLNNVTDPVRLGLQWLTRADNVDIDDTGMVERRDGYALQEAGVVTGAYGTLDTERMYFVVDGSLKTAAGVVLATGMAADRMHWDEINGQVFYSNGTDYGIVLADDSTIDWQWPVPPTPAVATVTGSLDPGLYRVCCTFVLADGRETGASEPVEITIEEGQALQISDVPQLAGVRTRTYVAPANSTVFQRAYSGDLTAFTWGGHADALGVELSTGLANPIPTGCTVIQEWGGRMYAAQYDPQSGTTALWRSLPLAWHLFPLDEDFIGIDGEVLMLARHETALIIGTHDALYALTTEGLQTLANYGVVPGCAWAIDQSSAAKTVYIWTKRGTCRFPEFANLTQDHVSVAQGVQAGAAVVQANGQTRFVVALHQGGTAFNARSV